MDPTACLDLIEKAAWKDLDGEAYAQACENLADWLRAGGFKPTRKPLQWIPGTNTPWTVESPIGLRSHWRLIRWDQGEKVEAFDLD
jgi:hypothetical protein